jgi:tetratricopeptide (TPR) repeat protein
MNLRLAAPLRSCAVSFNKCLSESVNSIDIYCTLKNRIITEFTTKREERGCHWQPLSSPWNDYHYYGLYILFSGSPQVLKNLGNACYAIGDYGKAVLRYDQRLQLAKKIQDKRSEEQSLNSLGIACEALGDYVKAISYYEQHLQLARQLKDLRSEEQALASLRVACYALGDYAKAMQYQK